MLHIDQVLSKSINHLLTEILIRQPIHRHVDLPKLLPWTIGFQSTMLISQSWHLEFYLYSSKVTKISITRGTIRKNLSRCNNTLFNVNVFINAPIYMLEYLNGLSILFVNVPDKRCKYELCYSFLKKMKGKQLYKGLTHDLALGFRRFGSDDMDVYIWVILHGP